MPTPEARNPFALALAVSTLLHALELAFLPLGENALLDALPDGARARVALAVMSGALLPAMLGGLLGALVLATRVGRARPQWARAAAVAAAGGIPALEALRHLDDARGDALRAYGLTAAAITALLLVFTIVAKPSAPVRARPSKSSVVLGAALAVAAAGVGLWPAPTPPRAALARDDQGAGDRSSAVAATRETTAKPPAAKNLLVLLVDTLRADHLGCYGYARETSPRIDRLATEGVRFANAATPKPKTSPAVASLFTGLWPETHHIHSTSTVLPDEHLTLAERLRDQGFHTLGVAANVNITPRFGFDQGFLDFRVIHRVKEEGRREDKHAGRVAAEFLDWLDERADDSPWFTYLHFIDPHSPYAPPKEVRDRFRGDALDGRLGTTDAEVGVDHYDEAIHEAVYLPAVDRDLDGYVARYDAEITVVDAAIGEILDALDRRGLREDTTVVFTADHGESMVEHHTWFNHGEHPYDEQVRIPLIVRGPGVARGEVRDEQVSLVSLMPTLLDLVGVTAPPLVEEAPFTSLLVPAGGRGEDPVERASESTGAPATFLSSRTGRREEVLGLRTARWKYLERAAGLGLEEALAPEALLLPGKRLPVTLSSWRDQDLSAELYDLHADPAERENLVWRRPEIRAALARRLEDYRRRDRPEVAKPRRMKERDLDDETAEELRQMGYLGHGGHDDDG